MPTVSTGSRARHAELLRDRGLRVTHARRLVLEGLSGTHHATVDQLAEYASRDDDAMTPSTIYRTLETLEAHGLVSHAHLGGDPKSYFLTGHVIHAHLVCRGCGSVQDMPRDVTDRLRADVSDAAGFDLDTGHLSVFGRCHDCVAQDLAI